MRRVLVLHTGASRAALIPLSHNFPSAPEGMSGPVLLKALERQALKYGAIIESSRVLALAQERVGITGNYPIVAQTPLQSEYLAKDARSQDRKE